MPALLPLLILLLLQGSLGPERTEAVLRAIDGATAIRSTGVSVPGVVESTRPSSVQVWRDARAQTPSAALAFAPTSVFPEPIRTVSSVRASSVRFRDGPVSFGV